MTVCYFGFYNREYSRNRILIKGLKQNNVKVIECQTRLKGIAKYFDLIKKHRCIKKEYDVMIVGFPGYQAVVLARFLTRKKIIFDAFTSLYDSLILDRKESNKVSAKAFYYWLIDFVSCKLANKILLDTYSHIDYFIKTFKLKRNKFERILVGSDDEIIKPKKVVNSHNKFLVHFHGKFIPLQGVEKIVKAAKLLEKYDVEFNIIGKGQTYKKIRKLAQDLSVNNINFIDYVPYEKLSEYMSKADVCLGIFGNTDKAKRVIPNKLYEALASGCPVITMETLAAKEILENKKNVLFCKNNSSGDLANKILELKNNNDLRDKVATNGYNLFKNNFTPKILGRKLKLVIENL
ncbi:glycosyltransferase [Candidatus Falkowbacteria bacterium]|jgi:glycosyltransferase involved in cell wall biosynthesis|nr:glycosyltransferase [Candidatus Falkowbacteria bacterium]